MHLIILVHHIRYLQQITHPILNTTMQQTIKIVTSCIRYDIRDRNIGSMYQETNQIITTYDKKIAAIGFNDNKITVNGSQKEIYAHAINRNGTTYLPISEMKDIYNIEIENIEDTKVITMDSLDREQKQAIVTSNLAVKSSTNFISKTVDRVNKVTYTISTYQNLRSIIGKNRSHPHYLMTLLYAENGDCEGSPKQMTIGDYYPEFKTVNFAPDVLEEDFDKIMQGSVSKTDRYKHYIVAYRAEHHAILEIELLLLDKDFAEVDKMDLIEYVNPDFASLTETPYEEIEVTNELENVMRPSLLKLKPGVKPALRAMDEEA